jgi:hypothetical protein
MKIVKLSLIILLSIILVGCNKTSKDIQNDLEAEGWKVTVIDEESLNQLTSYLGKDIIESKVNSVIWGMKGLKMGFVLEFKTRNDAKEYYHNLITKEKSDVYRQGKLVIISDSSEFIRIID